MNLRKRIVRAFIKNQFFQKIKLSDYKKTRSFFSMEFFTEKPSAPRFQELPSYFCEKNIHVNLKKRITIRTKQCLEKTF
jgi:hypothetical protein